MKTLVATLHWEIVDGRPGAADASRAIVCEAIGRGVTPKLAPGHLEVVWRMQVPAANHEHAACIARVLQADPDSPMSVFEVTDADGLRKVINLQDAGPFVH